MHNKNSSISEKRNIFGLNISNTQRSHSNKSDSMICIKALLGVSQSKLNLKNTQVLGQNSRNKRSVFKSEKIKTVQDATTEMPNVQDLKSKILELEDANPDLP